MLIVVYLLAAAVVTALWAVLQGLNHVLLLVPMFIVAWLGLHLISGIVMLIGCQFFGHWPIEKQSPFCRWGCVGIAHMLCTYAGIFPKLEGVEKLPKDSRFLYICNHRSSFDPLLAAYVFSRYNLSFISKPSNMNIIVVGKLSQGAGYLPIDREDNREALKTINTAADYLKKDMCSMAVYPEGTRCKDPDVTPMLPFHAGSFKIAQKAGVPVVVASVRYQHPDVKKHLFRPNRCYMKILDVIPAEQVKAMKTQELADLSSTMIRDSLREDVK